MAQTYVLCSLAILAVGKGNVQEGIHLCNTISSHTHAYRYVAVYLCQCKHQSWLTQSNISWSRQTTWTAEPELGGSEHGWVPPGDLALAEVVKALCLVP